MKTLIMYYSYYGSTKALANQKAQELGADIEEVIEVKKPIMPVGIYRAVTCAKTEIRPIQSQLDDYDKIIIMSPVWADHPVSAIYSVIDCLPEGKQVELVMVSGGGGTKSSCEGTKALVIARGCEIVGYANVEVKINRKTGEVITKSLDEKQDSSYLVPATVVCGSIILVAGLYGLSKLRKK